MIQTDGILNSFEGEETEQDTLNQTNGDGEKVEAEYKEKKSYASYGVYKFCASYEEEGSRNRQRQRGE